MENKDKYVAVVGSINIDMTITSQRWPKPGETLIGDSREKFLGGKGANQAVAAARAGSNVKMIGCVGNDAEGFEALKNLEINGVDTTSCNTLDDNSTGLAVITVCMGDNTIIVLPGANSKVSVDHVTKHLSVLDQAEIVLLQLEIPISTVKFVVDYCYNHDIPVVLNPAPFHEMTRMLYEKISYLTPNEHEASLMFPEANNRKEIFNKFGNKLIMTLGDQGVAFMNNNAIKIVSGQPVEVIDSTGAGDTFNGYLAASLAQGLSIEESILLANKAAGISVTIKGAQKGMPYIRDIKI